MANKAKETVTEDVDETKETKETEAVNKADESKEEKVEVFIPRGQANEDQNFFVSVNGKNYLLPKGQKSVVPKYVADEINRSFEAQEAMYKRIDSMVNANK